MENGKDAIGMGCLHLPGPIDSNMKQINDSPGKHHRGSLHANNKDAP